MAAAEEIHFPVDQSILAGPRNPAIAFRDGMFQSTAPRQGCRTLLPLKGAGLDSEFAQNFLEHYLLSLLALGIKTRTLEHHEGAAPLASTTVF